MKLPALTALLIAAAALPASGRQSPTLDDGLVGHWRLDENGGTAVDSSGHAISGEWAGGVTPASPDNAAIQFPNSGCARFDANRPSFIRIPNTPANAAINVTGDMTVSFWMNPDDESADWQRLVGCGSYTGPRPFGIWRDPQGFVGHRLLFQSCSDFATPVVEFMSVDTVPSYSWTHVACTISGTTATIYINGSPSGTATLTGVRPSTPDPLTFGAAVDEQGETMHEGFPGRLDDIRLFSRAFSEEEIAVLASGQEPSGPGDPVQLAQCDPITQAAIAPGGTTSRPGLIATADVATAKRVRLDVEVRPVGTAFSDSATATGALMSAGRISVAVSGLAVGQGYHWQVRAVDEDGRGSRWVPFGSDPDAPSERDFLAGAPTEPPALSGLGQIHPATGANLATGATLRDSQTVRFRAVIDDPNGARASLRIEIVPTGTRFTGRPTATSGLIADGGTAVVDIALAPGRYSWQASAINEWGIPSAWIPNGGDPDVVIVGIGSAGRGCSASPRGGFAILAAAALALLLRRAC